MLHCAGWSSYFEHVIMWSPCPSERILTVVLPYYNDNIHLCRQLAHFQKLPPQHRRQLCLIIIDDASMMHALDVNCTGLGHLSSFVPDYELRLYRIIQDIPWNQGGAKNLGAAAASSEWLFFLDQDQELSDNLVPNLLHALVGPINSLPAVPDYCLPVNSDHIVWRFERPPTSKAYEVFHPSMMAMRRSFFWRANGFNEDFSGNWGHEDSEFKLRLRMFHRGGLAANDQMLGRALPNATVRMDPQDRHVHGCRTRKDLKHNSALFTQLREQYINASCTAHMNCLPLDCQPERPPLRFGWYKLRHVCGS